MINFLANEREFRLADKRVVTVKRLPIGHYYLLISSVIIYKNAIEVVEGIKSKKKINEYAEYMRNNSMEFAKAKVEYENIKEQLKKWTDINTEKEETGIIFEVLSKVIEFNSIPKVSSGDDGIDDLDKLNEQFESVVSTLSILLKREPEYIYSNLDNFKAMSLLKEYDRMRVNSMNDSRHAHNASVDEYRKYTYKLLGVKHLSADEILSNPDLIGDIH